MSHAGTAVETEIDAGLESDIDASAEIEHVQAEARTYDEMDQDEVDRLARAQGWRPIAEYRGPPGRWVDAKSYLERGERDLPVLRDQNRRMTERLAKFEGEFTQLRQKLDQQGTTISEQHEILAEMRSFARNADQRGYERALAELEERQDNAAAAGDQVGVKQTREQIKALQESRPAGPEPEPTRTAAPPVRREAPPPPVEPPELTEIRGREPWIGTDPVLTPIVVAEDNKNARRYPDMPLGERFQLSVDNVKRNNPEYFPGHVPNRRQPAPPATPGTARAPGPGNRAPAANTIASIPDADDRAQAKRAFEKYRREFPDYTEAEYMEIYNNPKADVVDVQARSRKRG